MSDNQLHYFNPAWIQDSDETIDVDVCVYGGSSAGVIAAVKTRRLGHSAVLLHPGMHLGGMTTGGLGWTDTGQQQAIGGMSRQFYLDLGTRDMMDEENWHFWPSDAASLVQDMVQEAQLDVRFGSYLQSVKMDGRRVACIELLGGLKVQAKQFIDATYEGDLMAAANVSHTIGREGSSHYGESLNGVQVRDTHQFAPAFVDPFIKTGDPSSGILPHIEARDLRQDQGKGDHRVQAYNFRVCMTDDPFLKIDWQRPESYDPLEYELAARWFAADQSNNYNRILRDPNDHKRLSKFDILKKRTPAGFHKTDTNNHGPISSDFIGANYTWATADYAFRESIFQKHVAYHQGLLWFMANDERVPTTLRSQFGQWGLPKDEFTETSHWPHQLYVREARRMIADHVITEQDCLAKVIAEDSVGMGSYWMDSHNTSRFIAVVDGKPVVMNEGDVQVPPTAPYPISYRSVVPRRGECENLFVPVCFSASHIAYGSARMEPVFMVLGESVACAASLAIREKLASQALDYDKLRPMLEQAGQVLTPRE